MAQGQTMQSASNMMLFDPDMAQQQMDMMDDMSMSAKEYAEYWTDSLSTDGWTASPNNSRPCVTTC